MHFAKLTILLAGTLLSLQTWAAPAHIVILRHAEKVDDDELDLSPQGYARAQALAGYFTSPAFLSTYGTPVMFFAAAPKDGHSRRSVETLQPSADALHVPVNSTFGRNHGQDLMNSILADHDYDGQTVVICWNHQGIPDLLAPLNGSDFPTKWSHKNFDHFWILDQNAQGGWDFEDVPQNLLPGDSDF